MLHSATWTGMRTLAGDYREADIRRANRRRAGNTGTTGGAGAPEQGAAHLVLAASLDCSRSFRTHADRNGHAPRGPEGGSAGRFHAARRLLGSDPRQDRVELGDPHADPHQRGAYARRRSADRPLFAGEGHVRGGAPRESV